MAGLLVPLGGVAGVAAVALEPDFASAGATSADWGLEPPVFLSAGKYPEVSAEISSFFSGLQPKEVKEANVRAIQIRRNDGDGWEVGTVK